MDVSGWSYERWPSVPQHGVELLPRSEGPERCSSPPCAETSFCNLEVHLLYGRHWGLSRRRLGLSPSLPDRAASDQGPGQHTVTYGVVAARRPPMIR